MSKQYKILDELYADLSDNEWVYEEPYQPDWVDMPFFQLHNRLKIMVDKTQYDLLQLVKERVGKLEKNNPSRDNDKFAYNDAIYEVIEILKEEMDKQI